MGLLMSGTAFLNWLTHAWGIFLYAFLTIITFPLTLFMPAEAAEPDISPAFIMLVGPCEPTDKRLPGFEEQGSLGDDIHRKILRCQNESGIEIIDTPRYHAVNYYANKSTMPTTSEKLIGILNAFIKAGNCERDIGGHWGRGETYKCHGRLVKKLYTEDKAGDLVIVTAGIEVENKK